MSSPRLLAWVKKIYRCQTCDSYPREVVDGIWRSPNRDRPLFTEVGDRLMGKLLPST